LLKCGLIPLLRVVVT